MKNKENLVLREALAEMLSVLEYKVRNDVLTMDDVRVLLDAIEAGGGVRATIHDLAGYYGKKEVDVRNVLHRKYAPKPTRRLYYDFLKFREIVPRTWTPITSESED